ncbi:hypothetical protein NADFUDRAFT_48919 [Nadsonia fulvescens var. elongata DSM 6958]|uniref:RFX-type winged-helix domain-containing protein n=1 Tax=Nadsonia fulvescens var. elongata DSM 6958 TaxID=857566 RepID=A0A1E3PS74_9ASCO|nr:hypothetical protein NADFUDRAFT_48919 [Nadsonia fulvescens var. elongata DSM 6958]
MSRSNETYSASGRVLRHAPTPRVLYTPEVHTPRTRQERERAAAIANGMRSGSNTPYGNYGSPNSNAVNGGFNGAFYPSQPFNNSYNNNINNPINNSFPNNSTIPIPVLTPANNSQAFASKRITKPSANEMGAGQSGVDYMKRITMSLQSNLPAELDFALGALVQVSFANAELFKLKIYADMTRALIAKVLTSPLLLPDQTKSLSSDDNILDDILEDDSQAAEAQKVLEAFLVLRNASLDPENALVLVHHVDFCQLVLRGLQLPEKSSSTRGELRTYCVEIAESLSLYMAPLSAQDPYVIAFVNLILTTDDKSILIYALHALTRFMIRDRNPIALSTQFSALLIDRILALLLLRDESILVPVLDFLLHYTKLPANVSFLVSRSAQTAQLVSTHLCRLLKYNVEVLTTPLDVIRLPRRTKKPAPATHPTIPPVMLAELLKLDEPHRATMWMRTSYESDPDGEVTQISLWKAYESQFETYAREQGKRLLPAVDFIKNVTAAFKDSAAMVVNFPDGQRKFIIKGIRPRECAVSLQELNNPESVEPATTTMSGNTSAAPDIPPSPVWFSAVSVLQNMATSRPGKELLNPHTAALVAVGIHNPVIFPGVVMILETLSQSPLEGPVEE